MGKTYTATKTIFLNGNGNLNFPRDPSQRHSMFVSHSELGRGVDLASDSSASTLPAAAGSVDRLTGLEEKKPSRFFTLKPKGSFSLKPFFKSSSSSLVSLSPGKRRKGLERRDSGSQTDDSKPELGEIGVQTQNAPTIDVPVQTSFPVWEAGESYGHRRLASLPVRASPFWNRPYAHPGTLSSSTPASAVTRDTPSSPTLVKYATKNSPSFGFPQVSTDSVNSCQPVSAPGSPPNAARDSAFAGESVSDSVQPRDSSPSCSKDDKAGESPTGERYDNPSKTIVDDKNEDSLSDRTSLIASASDIATCDLRGSQPTSDKVQVEDKDFKREFQTVERPALSVLKTDRTDSPSKRQKTVHFDLPSPEPQSAVVHSPLSARNIDKDFEALLKDLNAWTDEDEALKVCFKGVPKQSDSTPPLLSQNLQSAIDCLRQDFLSPIPEISNECGGDEHNESEDCAVPDGCKGDITSDNSAEPDPKPASPEKLNFPKHKPSLIRSISEYDNQALAVEVNGSVTQAPALKSNSSTSVETDSLEGNVYDNVIKEENPSQAVALPTLPSFFEPPSQTKAPETAEIIGYADGNSSVCPSCALEEPPMPFDPEHSRVSRSSSRSSVRSNSKSGFDSCENLDQLEEEIIRSLYTPDEETMMKNIEIPPSESFQNSGTTATHMRRVILDQLLSGKSVQDILPSHVKHQYTPSAMPRSKFKPPKKYQAVITKLEVGENRDDTDGNVKSFIAPPVKLANESQESNTQIQNTVLKNVSPKKTSVFLFPEMDLTSDRVPEKSDVEVPASNGSLALKVRRSSWTSQATSDPQNPNKDIDDKQKPCDFTNCLKPSEIQNSPFLAKIHARSMSPCSFSPMPLAKSSVSPARAQSSPDKQASAVGECDFGSCLRPSQVQNSVFTKELSEITSGSSVNTLRAGSPLTVHTSSPRTVRQVPQDPPIPSPVSFEPNITNGQTAIKLPTKHKSELSIILKPKALRATETAKELPAEAKVNIPPPPPPLPTSLSAKSYNGVTTVPVRDEKPNSKLERPSQTGNKSAYATELEIKVQARAISETPTSHEDCKPSDLIGPSKSEENIDGKFENVNGSSPFNGNQNGSIKIIPYDKEQAVPELKIINGDSYKSNLENAVITDEPPPPGAVLLDKKVIVDGDKVHTDKYYAIPMKEVLKEKTSTTKFIPAPPKYEGIGPTEDGVPIGLRNSVKKENMHNWYKTMFKSLHKADSSNDPQEYIIGYTSEPESSKRDIIVRKKSSTLDNRQKYDLNSNYQRPYPSAKSTIEVYNVCPRPIEDYEPGYSSVTDDEVVTSRRYLPALNTPKASYEFKNGYESDTSLTRKRDQPLPLSVDQQKMWYREIQKGSDIPHFGLSKPAPEKHKDPVIGPMPPPPLNYSGPVSPQPGVRPSSLPANYTNQNGSSYCQQMNGAYEVQMRQVLHSEMQQRRSPSSNHLSPPLRTPSKSPCRSPDLRIPAQVLFDFKAESPKELSLKKSDIVLILRQLDKNWYEGELKGVVGIFPITYVEIIPPEHVSSPIQPRKEGLGRALYDFVAQSSVELTVRKGETIILLRRVDSNWFEATLNKKKGIIPMSYIQVLQEPVEKNARSPSTSSPSSPCSENREKLQNVNMLSPVCSPAASSPMPLNSILKNSVSPERKKLTIKKNSNLVEPVMYQALYSYSPQNADELELQEGDQVCVVEMCDDGWYVGTSVRTGIFGIFPGNYVEKSS